MARSSPVTTPRAGDAEGGARCPAQSTGSPPADATPVASPSGKAADASFKVGVFSTVPSEAIPAVKDGIEESLQMEALSLIERVARVGDEETINILGRMVLSRWHKL